MIDMVQPNNCGASVTEMIDTMTTPIMFSHTPARTICGILIVPVEKMIAFGGVATGNMNAQLAAIVIGTCLLYTSDAADE